MITKNQYIEDIIDKLNEGLSISSEERAELNRWAALSPENAVRLREEAEVMAATVATPSVQRFDSDAAFGRFMARIHEADGAQRPSVLRHRTLLGWVAAAAVAALFVITGATAFRMGSSHSAHYGRLVAEAPAGSMTMVTLPDGTTVNINSGSRISYSQGYGITDRDIQLDGQGYFAVVHNADMPLTVHTPHATVSDIGTEFDLCDYADDTGAVVSVSEGCVGMSPQGSTAKPHTVNAGYTARLDATTGSVSVERTRGENPYQWRTGIVKLTGQPMSEIADILSRAYGVTIVLKGRRADRLHFNGEFNVRVCSLTDVLEALAATNNLTYTVKGSLVEIR